MDRRFRRYDIVRFTNQDELRQGIVLDYNFRWKGEELEVVYLLHVQGEPEREVAEDEIEKIGQLEPPLPFYAVVEIFPKEFRNAFLIGKRGVVVGNAWNPKTNEWGFAVTLQSGKVWSFKEDELRNTGCALPPEVVEARWNQRAVHIAVSPLTGEGIVVGGEPGDTPEQFERYVPILVNLDEL